MHLFWHKLCFAFHLSVNLLSLCLKLISPSFLFSCPPFSPSLSLFHLSFFCSLSLRSVCLSTCLFVSLCLSLSLFPSNYPSMAMTRALPCLSIISVCNSSSFHFVCPSHFSIVHISVNLSGSVYIIFFVCICIHCTCTYIYI